MTAQEAVKRNEKAQGLRVWQVDDTWFYVESEDGKIAYKCCISEAVSSFLCKIFIGQFFEERQILTHFSYRA